MNGIDMVMVEQMAIRTCWDPSLFLPPGFGSALDWMTCPKMTQHLTHRIGEICTCLTHIWGIRSTSKLQARRAVGRALNCDECAANSHGTVQRAEI